MSKERQGEIARALVKRQMRKAGIQISQNDAREIGNAAKELNEIEPKLNVHASELEELVAAISLELFRRRFYGILESEGYKL